MAKGRILIVEDDHDISNMLKIYFTGQDYDIIATRKGSEALEITTTQIPQLIVLDINLPDMDGYAVLKQLRTNMRTKHIPAIFLTDKDDRSDRIAGLELGADDYITKPFDIEELELRIANAIRATERMGLTDPRSGLPSGRLIEDQLRELIRKEDWAYLDMRISDFDPFRDKYGFVAGDEVLRFTAMLISEIVDAEGNPDDFIGHAGNDNFVLISGKDKAAKIKTGIEKRFNEEVQSHYSFIDREQGGIKLDEGKSTERKVALMTIGVGMVDSGREFSDIREITEAAAEARRAAQTEAAPETKAAPESKAAPEEKAEATKDEAAKGEAKKEDEKKDDKPEAKAASAAADTAANAAKEGEKKSS